MLASLLESVDLLIPNYLTKEQAGCADLRRPPASDLAGVALLAFVLSAASAALPGLLKNWNHIAARIHGLPPFLRWRAMVTVAALHQPLAMLVILPPNEVWQILMGDGNPWLMTAPRNLWLALFYLFGAWAFEVMVLIHPSTGARKAYGKKGWWIQIVHHVGFPSMAVHNIFSGCAVPGVAMNCQTELTVLFTSTYWLLKTAGVQDHALAPLRQAMVIATYTLRGAFLVVLDVRAILNDKSEVPMVAFCIQCTALVVTNMLNIMIIRLVQKSVAKQKASADKKKGPAAALEQFSLARPGPCPVAAEVSVEKVRDMIKQVVKEASGIDVEVDKPLMESGIDSRAAVDFYNRLSSELPGITFPTTLVFDYPTLSAVATYTAGQIDPVGVSDSLNAAAEHGSLNEPLAVIGTSCLFPGGSSNYPKFLQALSVGGDGFVEIPFTRWEIDEYYDPNPDAPGKMYPRHGAFVPGADQFDAVFFEISAPEARAMDPQHRLVLEVSYDGLYDSGSEKKRLLGTEVGVLVGLSNNDWIQVQSGDIKKLSPYTAIGTSASIGAARVAYALGLKGPTYTVDTACSSALVALDSAAMNVRRARCVSAVSAASNVMASAATYISFSKPRMLSPSGRCFTFDASADGYGRGEGAGAVVIRQLSHTPELAKAVLNGIAVNQDGRSATMTAPNGPSQQAVISTSLQEAGMMAVEVAHMECHGTGTPLGDPIELGALNAVNIGRASDGYPLILAAVKSNLGHLEGAAACPGIMKTVLLLQIGVRPSSLHIRSLNPHIGALTGFAKSFPSENVLHKSGGSQRSAMRETGALSSFGFGGTNAHAVLASSSSSARACRPTSKTLSTQPRYNKKSFAWRDIGFRLLRRQVQENQFEVVMNSDVYDVAAHHVVFDSIVVPGVVFTEMALEATRKIFGHRARLTDVAMVFPFPIQTRASEADPAPVMRFVLQGEKRFQIQSTSVNGKVSTHVEGGIDQQPKAGDDTRSAKVDLKALGEQVNEVVDPATVYEAIHSVGLWLGPMFQVTKQVWRKQSEDGTSEILAMLRLDPKVPNVGYVVHPALFDGTIHTLAAASIGKKHEGGLMIFAGVGRVTVVQQENFSQLEKYWIYLHVFETTETSQTFNVKIMSDDGVVLMLMDDVVFRSVRPEQIQLAIAAQGTPEDEQKIYETEWSPLSEEPASDVEASGQQGVLVLAGDASQLEELSSSMAEGQSCALLSAAKVDDLTSASNIVSFAGVSSASPLDVLSSTLELMQKLMIAKRTLEGVWIVTCSTQAVAGGDMEKANIPLHAGLWGLVRTFRNECPDVRMVLLDVDQSMQTRNRMDLLQEVLSAMKKLNDSSEVDVASRCESDGDTKLYVPRLMDATSSIKSGEPIELVEDASYVISGGLGALGLIFAQWMLEKNAKHIALLSRSGKPPADCRSLFKKLSSKVVAKRCDVVTAKSIESLMRDLKKEMPPVRGIIHAAGLVRDSMISKLEKSDLEAVLGPKLDGTLNLHSATSALTLDFFALFSTFAAAIGSVGQANYNSANAFMDSFSSYRRAHNLPAVSIQWGPWADAGIAARAGTSEATISRTKPARGLEAMEAILSCQSTLRNGVVGVASVKWKALLSLAPKVPPFFEKFNSAVSVKKVQTIPGGMTQDAIKNLVVDTLKDVMDADDIDLSTPLMEMGLDSLAGVEFRNRLQASFEGLQLSSTLMFDYPSVPDLVEYIYEEIGTGEDDIAGGPVAVGDIGEQIAIAGHSERVPGSISNDPRELWNTLIHGMDTASELPPERWDMTAFFSEDQDVPGKTYVKLGHFIPGIEKFDGQFFGLGEAEQRGMDPHQWLTVEITYDAFHAAGFVKDTLNGLDCGVYVGCATLGGIDLDIPAMGPFHNIGYAYSGLSGRVSHVFSLRGPCFTVDTACSSTVVALDCGCQAVRLGRCTSAVASGVNIQISAAIWVGFSKMRGLAMDGRCKTFDSRADGFARGEGLGSVFVQRAAACTETSPAIALLSGVATNHDGKAATITAPNGTAQQRVIRSALAERGTVVDDVSGLECHGTGTALGDPIETGAQKAVYGKGNVSGCCLALMAVKTNLGHLEGSAGVAGISKCIMVLQNQLMPANILLKDLNSNIDLSGYKSMMPTEAVDFRVSARRTALSSFGFSGTNGHCLVEAVVNKTSQKKPGIFARRLLKPVNEWLQKFFYTEEWVSASCSNTKAKVDPCLVIGNGAVSTSLRKSLPGVASSNPSPITSDTCASALEECKPLTIIFSQHLDADGEEVPGATFQDLLTALQAAQKKSPMPKRFLLLTRGAWDTKRPSFDSGAALWGLLRSARLELLGVTLKAIDVPLGASPIGIAKICKDELAAPDADLDVCYRTSGRCVPRLRKSPDVALKVQKFDAVADESVLGHGVQLVTGGLGSLGLTTAHQLAELGARSLVLTSRGGRVAGGSGLESRLERLQGFPGISVILRRCDVASREDVGKLIAGIASPTMPLRGVIHAAGVLERCSLANLNMEEVAKVMAPKANGAWNLHTKTKADTLGLFVLFSSISATIGLTNGATYSAASAYLDALALWRWERYGGLSVKFGPVAENGMNDVDASRLQSAPLQPLETVQAASALRYLLTKQGPSAGPGAEVMLAKADWGAFTRELGLVVPQLADFKPEDEASEVKTGTGSSLSKLSMEERQASVLTTLRSEAMGMGLELADDMPLMEAGIDSLSAVEFRSKITREFREIKLSSTLMFDFPTLKAISSHIAMQLGSVSGVVASSEMTMTKFVELGDVKSNLSVIGVACTLPGNCHSLKEMACMLTQAAEGIVEMPYSRWDVDAYFDPATPTGLEMYVRHGGFIDNADFFDAELFNMSKTEIMAMDPQQRHLLEIGLDAFVDAGIAKSELMGVLGGVFVGQDKCDWNRMLTAAHSGPFAATGGSASISSNRISYALGLKGPSCTIDTACSSSLVAADTAAATLRRGRCEIASVCGVNMLLLPQTFVACCQARMLAMDGRCKTFDQSASGYTRGEGCGSHVLESVSERVAVAAFSGSALNQDGRSANLTSPNGPSQQAVVQAALTEAQVLPHALDFLETHGTGTELGDPIEVGALQAIVANPSRVSPLLTGAVKTNVGHLEGGAGIAGMLKLVSVLQWTCGFSNLNLRVLNPHIEENSDNATQHFLSESVQMKARGPCATSVSSFGFGGTNGHVVLSIPVFNDASAKTGGPVIGAAKSSRPTTQHQRQQFAWRDPGHPLIRKRTQRAEDITVYSCSIEGHVLELLSHHIVHGEVVVPGACYLEMIIAGVTQHLGRQEAWCIEGLGFAKPLVLRLVDGVLEEPAELRLVLWDDGRLEVESEVGSDPEENIITTHVEASYVRKSGGWAANKGENDTFSFDALRESCPKEIDIDLMYSFGVRCGLPLQKRFRAVRQVQRGEKNGFARLEMERDGTHVGFWIGPSVIDSTFQALMSLGDEEHGIGSLKIPLSIRRLQPTGRSFSIAVWSYFELVDFTEKSTVFRAWLMNDAGEVLLHFDDVHLQEVRDEHIQKVLQASGREDPEQRALYDVEWRLAESGAEKTSESADNAGSTKDRWLVLGGEDGMRDLSLEGDASCHCLTHGEGIDLLEQEAVSTLLEQETWTAVAFVAGLSGGGDVDTLNLALHLVRAAVALGAKAPPIILLTKGAQPLASEDDEVRKSGSTTHAGLWGFARAVRAEYPDNLRISCLDLDPSEAGNLGKSLASSLPALSNATENEVAERAGGVYANRLVRSSVPIHGPIRLNMPARGALSGLRPVPQPVRQAVLPGFVQLRIRAVGLNFRDVLNVMGLYPGDPGPPGADCSGTVIKLGEGVKHLELADDVFGEAPGCLSTYSSAPAALLTQKPKTWSFEESSTMPVIFVTVEESLGDLAKLKRGEKVLIHAAAGGVGLVAIQYAQYVGAEIYATAGAQEKHDFLRSLGVKYITSTRNGQQFEDDMKKFLAESGADGVDVVINSLSHDEYIPRSLALLRKGGRFMEIGKRGIWSHEEMKAARPDVMYEKIAADTMMEKEPWRYNSYLKRLLARVDEGGLTPINMHVFEGLQKGVAALEFLQRARNIGKVVIKEPSRMLCRPDATTLLSGGTGAVGQVCAQFLVEEGSKSLCLLSRSGRPSMGSGSRWEWLQAAKVNISVQKCDVASEASVIALKGNVTEPISGLLHLAAVLADGMLPTLTKESFAISYGAKVHGLRFLRQHLPFEEGSNFVLFSSTSSWFGAPGQANYAAANSVLDSIAPHWTAQGQHRVRSIQWGTWGEVGMAVEKGTLQRLKGTGLGPLSNAQGMSIMGSILDGARCTVGAAHINWNKFLRTAYVDVPRFLEDMQAEVQRTAPADSGDGGGDDSALASLSPEERLAMIQSTIQRLAQEVVDDDLPSDAPLLESGMDSLAGVEFRNRLLMEFRSIRIPNSAVFDYPTVAALSEFVNAHYSSISGTTAPIADGTVEKVAEASSSSSTRVVEHLNERTVGVPIFLVPGAGLQSGSFRSLASLLPVPAYALTWPRGFAQDDDWPKTLTGLAELLLHEIQSVWPSGPYCFAGHSFGATLSVEMARIAEAAGLQVALVALLDPRSLRPISIDLGDVYTRVGLTESLALISQTAEEGARYSGHLEELMRLDASERDVAIERLFSPAALASLMHVHQTSRWYAELLMTESDAEQAKLTARVLLLQAQEEWQEIPSQGETAAASLVRAFQKEIFQVSDEVLQRVSAFSNAEAMSRSDVLGGHFEMLREPGVVTIALQLCHALVEAVKASGNR